MSDSTAKPAYHGNHPLSQANAGWNACLSYTGAIGSQKQWNDAYKNWQLRRYGRIIDVHRDTYKKR